MYGDTRVIRRKVAALREQGIDLRLTADRLVSEADQIDWQGRAADAMRERVRERASHLRDAASRHDTAAESLERHATETDRLKDAIAEAEHRGTSLIEDARGRVEALAAKQGGDVTIEPDPADAALLAFTPPPAGHQDWLDAELPGHS